MNIAIDVSPLTSAHEGRGVGVYTKLLLESLLRYEKNHKFLLLKKGESIPPETDVVHYPFFDPLFLTLPIYKPRPTVVTVHDLIPIVFPDKFPSGIRGAMKWQIQKMSLGGAKRILADSQTSKKDIHRLIGFPLDSIDAVYLGPSLPNVRSASSSALTAFLRKYNVTKNYILYIGDVNWNKNILGLLRAFKLVTQSAPDVQLVLCGRAFLEEKLAETKEIRAEIHTLGIDTSVIMPGFVPGDIAAALLAKAVCLVSPSYYEGFGLPVIDAMTHGCPVVTSDNSSLSEIAGPSMKVDPTSTEAIAGAMQKIIRLSDNERKRLIYEECQWVKQFSWKRTAHETVVSYEKALA